MKTDNILAPTSDTNTTLGEECRPGKAKQSSLSEIIRNGLLYGCCLQFSSHSYHLFLEERVRFAKRSAVYNAARERRRPGPVKLATRCDHFRTSAAARKAPSANRNGSAPFGPAPKRPFYTAPPLAHQMKPKAIASVTFVLVGKLFAIFNIPSHQFIKGQ